MTDLYTQIANTPLGKLVVKNAGLPSPVPLERYSPGDPVIRGRVLLGTAPGGRLAGAAASIVAATGAEAATTFDPALRSAAAEAGLDAGVWEPETAADDAAFKALVFDASGIESLEDLSAVHAFFSPTIRRVRPSGRVIVLAGPASSPAQRALEGFTRSVGKELRAGATAQLVRVAHGGEDALGSTLRFLLSAKSAYVDGQVISVSEPVDGGAPAAWERPLEGRVALVTGASRGIGAAIAATLARDGAHVVGLDIPALADDLDAVTGDLGGSSLALDITADDAPKAIAAHLRKEHKGVDVVVHNAGITRDKTLGRMTPEVWESVIAVNVIAPQRITEALTSGKGLIRRGGRVIGVSSISGIAGNAGQTNYATSKAAVIGLVDELAPRLAEAGVTVNAIAPGFIETEMTARMPIALREGGRRMNSLRQGGLPVDVAEAVAWLAQPASGGVNGNVVRVCGQSMIGA